MVWRDSIFLPIIILIIVIMLVVATLYLRNPVLRPNVSSNEIVVIDTLNRTISLSSRPSKIISLAPSITEIIFSLDLEEKLVGVDSSSFNTTYLGINTYCRLHEIADVGGYWWSEISIEKILSLNPDLILADAGAHIKLNQTFNEYGLKVIYLNGGSSSSIDDVLSDIDIIATIFNVGDRGEELKNNILEKIENAKQYVDEHGLRGLKVLVVIGFNGGIWVAGLDTFIDNLLNRIGLSNAAEISGWGAVSIEELVKWDPDVVIVASMGIDYSIVNESGLPMLNKPIILLNNTETDILLRPGPRVGDAALVIVNRLLSIRIGYQIFGVISPYTTDDLYMLGA